MSTPPIEVTTGTDQAWPQLLTALQAAECLAVSARTLWTLTSRGEIPCVRMGRSVRYDAADPRAFIAGRKSVNNVK